jgi:hypothetical protein
MNFHQNLANFKALVFRKVGILTAKQIVGGHLNNGFLKINRELVKQRSFATLLFDFF